MAQIILDSSNNLIQGDFDNATVNNRTKFKTTTTNATTNVYAVPNGSATSAGFTATNAADPTNASKITIATNGSTDTQIISGVNGTGTYLPLSFYTNNALAMQVDTSGNVGIGTTPIYKFDVLTSDASVYSPTTIAPATQVIRNSDGTTGSSSILQFRAANSNLWNMGLVSEASNYAGNFVVQQRTGASTYSERMRIDSNGNVLVGKTSASASVGNGAMLYPNGYVSSVGTTAGLSDTYNYYNTTAAAYRFYVTNAGVINATNTTISAISDQRLKENIKDLDIGLDAVMGLKPRKFDWKKGKGKDIKGDRGFIAQEFETIFPDLIDNWKDPAPEGEEPYKSVRADLIPVLVKAIQEQQTIINELKTRIEALENK